MRLILASESPRRADLLRAAGFEIEIVPSRIDERQLPGETPDDYVRRLATAKARAAAGRAAVLPIVAADTIVLVDGQILGKPADDGDAVRMLRVLSGRSHEVLTGVSVLHQGREQVQVERTLVHVAPLSEADIAWYVGTGEPRDKAGAYAVQGLASRYIDKIEGSYSNVVGLPVSVVCRLLRAAGGRNVRFLLTQRDIGDNLDVQE